MSRANIRFINIGEMLATKKAKAIERASRLEMLLVFRKWTFWTISTASIALVVMLLAG